MKATKVTSTKVTLQVLFFLTLGAKHALLFLKAVQMLYINFRIGHLFWEYKLPTLVL